MARFLSLELLWSRSLQTGKGAKRIAQLEGASKQVIEAAFTAGLLHDIGILLLASCIPCRYGEVIARAEYQGESLCSMEREVLGASHEEVGAYLLGLWALPDNVVEAVAFHHRPGCVPSSSFSVLTAVHAAGALIAEARGCREPHSHPGLDLDHLVRIAGEQRVGVWREEILAHAGIAENA